MFLFFVKSFFVCTLDYTKIKKACKKPEDMIQLLERNRIIPRTITFAIFIFIFYISSLQFGPAIAVVDISSVLYHIFVFFLLTIFLFISVLNRKWETKKITIGMLVLITYAALDELHQFFVPGRSSSLGDLFLDLIGMAFASLLYFIMIEKKKIT